MGQIKQRLEPTQPTPEYVHQGFGSFLLRIAAIFSEEANAIVSTYDAATNLMDMFSSWFNLIGKYVCKAYTTVKDAVKRSSLTIYHAVEAAVNCLRDSLPDTLAFISMLLKCGIRLATDSISAIILASKNCADAVVSKFNAMFGAKEKVEEKFKHQSFGIEAMSPLITTVVLGMLGAAAKLKIVPSASPANFYKTMNALSSIEKFDFSKLASFANVIYHAITGRDLTVEYEIEREFNESTSKLIDCLQELDNSINPTAELQMRITSEFLRMERSYPALLSDGKRSQARTTLYKHLESKVRPWVAGVKNGAPRVKPVVIVLSGTSGTGKTSAQKGLVAHVPQQLAAIFEGKDREDVSIYAAHARMSTSYSIPCLGQKNEFDDGYRDPLFYCLEEYQTTKIDALKTEWFNHFMKCIDDQPYPLNMAFDKGNRYFNSPFVIATGNFKNNTHHTPVEDPEAYYRRLELDLIVTRAAYDGPFDPYKHSVFTPSPTMIRTLKGDKTPSLYLKEYFTKNGYGPFNYDTLLSLVVGTYIDRLITYHVTNSPSPKAHLAELLKSFIEKADTVPDGFRVYTKSLLDGMPASPSDRSNIYSRTTKRASEAWKRTYNCLLEAFECFKNPRSPWSDPEESTESAKDRAEGKKRDKSAEAPSSPKVSQVDPPMAEPKGDVRIEDVDEKFEHQSKVDVQKYEVPNPPPGALHAMAVSERLDDMLDMCHAFLEIIDAPEYKGMIFFARPTEIMKYLQYKTLDPYVAVINWDPTVDEQCYPENPWIHLHFFDKAALRAKGYVRAQNIKTTPRSALAKGQWTNMKKFFGEMYFHWYMAIHSCMRVLDMKGDRRGFDRYIRFWKAARPFMNAKEFGDLRRDVRLSFGKDLSDDCKVVSLPPSYVNKYKARVSANLKRTARQRWDKEEARRLEREAAQAEKALLEEDDELEKNENAEREVVERKPRGFKTYTEVQREQRVHAKRGALSRKGARLDKLRHQMKDVPKQEKPFRFPRLTQTGVMPSWIPLGEETTRFFAQKEDKVDVLPCLNLGWSSYVFGDGWEKQWQGYLDGRAHGVYNEVATAAALIYYSFRKRRGIRRGFTMLNTLKTEGVPYMTCSVLASMLFTDDNVITFRIPNRYVEVARDMSPDAIMRLAKREVLKYHPDKNRDASADDLTDARALLAVARGRIRIELYEGLMRDYPHLHPLQLFAMAYKHEAILPSIIDASVEVMDGLFYGQPQDVELDNEQFSATDCLFHHILGTTTYDKNFKRKSQVGEMAGIVFDVALTAAGLYFLSPLFVQMFNMAKKFVNYVCPRELDEIDKMLAVEEALPILHQMSVRPNTPPIERPDASHAIMEMLKGGSVVHQVGSGDAMIETIVPNMYKVRHSGVDVATTFFMHSTLAIFNAHVWEAIPHSFTLVPYVKVAEITRYDVSKSFCTVLEIDKVRDRCVVSIPNVRAHRDITRHIASRADIDRLPTLGNALMCCLNPAGKLDVQLIEEMRHFKTPLSLTREYTLSEFASYNWSGARPGACGSVLCAAVDGRLKIIGYHDAGKVNAKVGVSTYLPSEEVQQFTPLAIKQHPAFKALDPTSKISLEPEGELYKLQVNLVEEVGNFSCPYSTYATGPTLFRPTDFATLKFRGGAPKIPADLSREAYNKALVKETRNDVVNVPPVVPALMKEYAEDILDTFYGGQRLMPCRTLTPEEALYGYKDLNNFDKDTAKGLRLKHWGLSKKKVLEGGEEGEKFLEKFRDIQGRMKEGTYEYQLNCDKLKDEPRDPERVALKKTRVFKVTDFVDNVHMKCAFGDLVNQTHNFHWLTPSSCGVDPTASEWRLIANTFEGHDVIESDISGFETVVTWLLFYLVNPLIKKVYTGWSLDYAAYVIVATINALRFESGKGRFLGWQNTSGNWLTTWINTLANMGFFSTVLIANALMRDLDPRNVLRLLKIKLYSDDNLTALPYSWWNSEMLSESFKKMFNIELTGNDKGVIAQAKQIWECTFLSRGFRKEGGQVYAPLAMDSLFSQLYYVRIPKKNLGDSRFMYQQLQQNLDNVFRELMEYPLDEAEKFKEEIVDFIVSNGIPLSVLHINIDRGLLKLLRQ